MNTFNKHTYGKRAYNHVKMSDEWEEDIALRDVPTVCPECGATLTPREGWIPNGSYDSGGSEVRCECGYTEFQVQDVPVKRR